MLSPLHTPSMPICWPPWTFMETLDHMARPALFSKLFLAGRILVLLRLTDICVQCAQHRSLIYDSLWFHVIHYSLVWYSCVCMRPQTYSSKSLLSGLPIDPLIFLTGGFVCRLFFGSMNWHNSDCWVLPVRQYTTSDTYCKVAIQIHGWLTCNHRAVISVHQNCEFGLNYMV
jgi:hypothetical protein